ncbi:MAG: ABC transporter permease, partial [Solirubrobacteraceae bacterium]
MQSLIAIPRGWIESFGDIVRFCSQVVSAVLRLRVLSFFGETLRQAGILVVGSCLVIWGLVFITGLECGIEGAYFN